MSLMGTLAKVAIGVAVAKGVSSVMVRKTTATVGTDGSFGGPHSPGRSGGGLEDMMGEVLGGKRSTSPTGGGAFGGTTGSGGGLGDFLNELGQYAPGSGGAAGGSAAGGSTTGQRGGGIDDLIGSLGQGGGSGGSLGDLLGGILGGTQGGGTAQSSAAPGGSLGDLLGGLLGGAAGGAASGGGGGLGDLLGGLLGGAAGGAASGGGGSFGDLLNQSLGNRGEPDAAPTPAQNAVAGLMLRAMIQAAKADGRIDAAEQKKLLGNLGDVSAAEKRFVEAEMQAPIDVAGLARQVPKGLEVQVYSMSLMAIDLDNQTEATYLHQLATAMGLNKQVVNQIHARAGAPALYA
jgi:uncharacterized membrane protein YebE (DUF533 family)